MHPLIQWPAVVALAALVSGCASPSERGADSQSITTFTDPFQNRTQATDLPHLHDYWGKNPRLVVVNATLPFGALKVQSPGEVVFQPEPGTVVPQGAGSVEVTLSWEETDPTNQYSAVRLAVRSAADREPQDLGEIGNGQTVSLASTNERNDLPHQVVSGWEFHWIVEPALLPSGQKVLSYQGSVSARVEAVRGLEIPVYPGHPDRWQGRTEIQLFTGEGRVAAEGDPNGESGCFGGCLPTFAPANGTVVPINADHVSVQLERMQPFPMRLGLRYHDATTHDWTAAVPIQETPTSRTYFIDVLQGGDGPYAQQSQWEFQLFIETPVENGAAVEDYRISASVHKFA